MEVEEGFRFKCPCTNPYCDLEDELQNNADASRTTLKTIASFLGTLKATLKATASTVPIAELKKLAERLLQIVGPIRHKNEVKHGFNHIIADCCRIACVVRQHAERRKQGLSPIVEMATEQLIHDLEAIRKYAHKQNERGSVVRTIKAAADKAELNEWRQRLATSWGVFTTQLQMDTNYHSNKSRSDNVLDVANGVEKIFEQMVAKKGNGVTEYFSEHAQPPVAPKAGRSKRRIAQPQRDDQPQGDYQCLQNEWQSSEYSNDDEYYSVGNFDDPQTYDSARRGKCRQYYESQDQQYHHPQAQQYPQSDTDTFRSQTTYPVGTSKQQYFSDPEYYANGHLSGHSNPHDDYSGHGYQQPQPPRHRYDTLLAPPPPSLS